MNERTRRILEVSTLAAALTLTAAFSFYCFVLMRTVSREREEVATRVEWLHRAQVLVEQRDPAELAELRRSVAEHERTKPLTDALAADELDDFVAAVRRELTSLSVQLAARWDALSRVAFVALALAGLATVLLWRSQHRRRSAERLRVELVAALAEVKRAHVAAQAANEAKSDALTYVSHEFRTPLQAIVGIGGLLSARTLADDQRYLHASTLRSVSEGLLRLVDDLLDLSRIERDQLSIHVKSFDPRVLFVECTKMLRGQAEEKALRLTCELAADLPAGVIGACAWMMRLPPASTSPAGRRALPHACDARHVCSTARSRRAGCRFSASTGSCRSRVACRSSSMAKSSARSASAAQRRRRMRRSRGLAWRQ